MTCHRPRIFTLGTWVYEQELPGRELFLVQAGHQWIPEDGPLLVSVFTTLKLEVVGGWGATRNRFHLLECIYDKIWAVSPCESWTVPETEVSGHPTQVLYFLFDKYIYFIQHGWNRWWVLVKLLLVAIYIYLVGIAPFLHPHPLLEASPLFIAASRREIEPHVTYYSHSYRIILRNCSQYFMHSLE